MTYKAMFENPDGTWYTASINSNDKISEHFLFSEIANPSCSVELKLKWYQDSIKANKAIEYVRGKYGKALPISCCYREEAYNKKVGGETNSLHLKGCAYDCQLGNVSNTVYANFLRWCECACERFGLQGELGRYSWGLHIAFATKLPYAYNGLVYQFDKR